MADQPIDLETIRQIDAKIDRVLEAYPELRASDPEREQALAEWLKTLEQEGAQHGE